MATVGYAAYSTPIDTAEGVTNCITRTPPASSTVALPAMIPITTSHTTGRTIVKMSTTRARHSSTVVYHSWSASRRAVPA
jgi:hypothetical protein